MFDITSFILDYLSKIIKEFGDFPYQGYVRKRSKHMSTDSYFYLARHLAKCMMRFNIPIGPLRTQMTNMLNMNNHETSMQKIPNSHVCSLGESEPKSINADEIG